MAARARAAAQVRAEAAQAPQQAPPPANAYRTSPDGFPAPLAGQVPQPAPPRSHTNGCLADYPG